MRSDEKPVPEDLYCRFPRNDEIMEMENRFAVVRIKEEVGAGEK